MNSDKNLGQTATKPNRKGKPQIKKECKHLENNGARMASLWSAEHVGMPPPTKHDTAELAQPPGPVHAMG